MDNDGTQALSPQQNAMLNKGQINSSKAEQNENYKQSSKFVNQVAATAIGVAVGTGAAMAAEHIYKAAVEDAVSEEDSTAETTAQEVAKAETPITESQVIGQENPHHTIVEHVVHVKVEQTDPTVTEHAIPTDDAVVDTSTIQVTPTTATESDDEVHVIGVAVQDNGYGGMATLAGIQSGDDAAILIDVESDGTIDIIAHDDNKNGQLEVNELHQVQNVPFSTGDVVGAYVAEAQAQGAEAVVKNLDTDSHYKIIQTEDGYGMASMEDSNPIDNMYTASNEDMPDCSNDAETGFVDV